MLVYITTLFSNVPHRSEFSLAMTALKEKKKSSGTMF